MPITERRREREQRNHLRFWSKTEDALKFNFTFRAFVVRKQMLVLFLLCTYLCMHINNLNMNLTHFKSTVSILSKLSIQNPKSTKLPSESSPAAGTSAFNLNYPPGKRVVIVELLQAKV